MKHVLAQDFAETAAITTRAAQQAFSRALSGKPWRGLSLPVRPIPGQRGGAGGVVYALDTDAACPGLRAMLHLPSLPVEAPFERSVEAASEPARTMAPPAERGLQVMRDKRRIVASILVHPLGSSERAKAFRAVAAEPHDYCGKVKRFSQSTLRDWVRAMERRGDAALFPKARADKGKKRVLITKAWDEGCGLTATTSTR